MKLWYPKLETYIRDPLPQTLSFSTFLLCSYRNLMCYSRLTDLDLKFREIVCRGSKERSEYGGKWGF